MAAADTCCMPSGWDLSFLDSEAKKLQHLQFSCKGDFHRRSHRGAITTAALRSSVYPSNPLGSVVRRGSNAASSQSSRQAPASAGPTGGAISHPSFELTNSVNDSSDHIYQNEMNTSSDVMEWIVSRGVMTRRSTSSSTSSSSEEDLPTTAAPHHRLHCSFLQTPPSSSASVCRSSRSPVSQSSLVFPPQELSLALLSQSTQKNGDVYARVTRLLSAWDDDQLATAFYRLSLCRFYLCRLSFDEAKHLLRRYPVGTFLLRDSSDERFPFALSVQTRRGTTSIRIVCECGGRFRLDCEPEQVHLMPSFDCVVALIQFYVRQGERRTTPNNLVLQELNGRRDLPVLLRRPFETEAPSLAHLCRKRINGILGRKSVNRLQLLPSLKDFLNDYPYDI